MLKVSGYLVLLKALIPLVVILGSCEGLQQVEPYRIAETCSANFITQDFKDGWDDRVYEKVWKLRLANKQSIYAVAQAMYDTVSFKKFDESDFKKGCIAVDKTNGWMNWNMTGYQGRSFPNYLVKTNIPHIYRLNYPPGHPLGPGGSASILLSDNESFIAFDICLDNGLRAFGVWSPNELDEYTRKAIKLHLKSVGFKEEHFVDLYPDSECIQTHARAVLEPIDNSDLPVPAPRTYYAPGIVLQNLIYPQPPLFWKKK